MKFEPRKADMVAWHRLLYKLAAANRGDAFAKIKLLSARILEAFRNSDLPDDQKQELEALAKRIK